MNRNLALEKYKSAICVFTLLMVVNTLIAQINEWSTQPSVGVHYTTLKTERYSFPNGLHPNEVYFQNTINLSLSAPITQRLRLGLQYITIANRVIREPVDRAYAAGALFQFNFLARKRLSVYFEGGYTLSNLCTCGEAEIYTADTLNHYVHFGFGMNYKLNSRFHLNAGFINYSPVYNSDIYNWTQPFIGLKYHFYKKYNTPIKSRFREQKDHKSGEVPIAIGTDFHWIDEDIRTWNIGLQITGPALIRNLVWQDPNVAFARYHEFTITPRINYWINQAVMVGLQGSYYYYDNQYNSIPQTNGIGLGAQARFYPLSFKKPTEFRAYRIFKNGDLNVVPMLGAEIHVANFSWLEPENAGEKWQYFDFQPSVGFVLSYKDWFNMFYSIGPTIGSEALEKVTPMNSIRMVGLEYNF